MIKIDEFLEELKTELLEKYPNKEVPNELMKMFKYDINHQISTKAKKPHKTIKLEHFKGFTCDIDENIAKLIKYIWMCRIDTNNSCEDNVPRGYVWIEFSTSMELDKFLNIVFKDTNIDDDHFIRGLLSFPYNTENSWIYEINFIEHDYESPTVSGLSSAVSVRFPKIDYDWICDRMEKYLESENKLLKYEYVFIGQFYQKSNKILVTCSKENDDFDEYIYEPVMEGYWNVWAKTGNVNTLMELVIAYCGEDITKNVMATEYNTIDFNWQYREAFNHKYFSIIDYESIRKNIKDEFQIDGNIKINYHGIELKYDHNEISLCTAKKNGKIIGMKFISIEN